VHGASVAHGFDSFEVPLVGIPLVVSEGLIVVAQSIYLNVAVEVDFEILLIESDSLFVFVVLE
jgi:hypothetical protein